MRRGAVRKILLAIASLITVVLALPVGCAIYYFFGIELVEQHQVRSTLASLPALRVLDLVGDFDVGISATVQREGDNSLVMTFGAITDIDFLRADWISLERIGDISLWSVGCFGVPGLTRQSWAMPGVAIEPGSPIGRRVRPPISTIRDALDHPQEILSVIRALPSCDEWQHESGIEACTSSTEFDHRSVHDRLPSDACPEPAA
jgi:hypothetical protein